MLNQDQLIHLSPYVLSLLISLGVGAATFRRRSVPGAGGYSLVAFSMSFWIFGYIFELLSPTLQGKLFWDDLQWIPIPCLYAAYLKFSLDFTGVKIRHERWLWSTIMIFPVAFLVLLFNPGTAHLVRDHMVLQDAPPFGELSYPFTPLIWVLLVYIYAVFFLAVGLLVVRYVKPHRLYRTQVGILIIGILIPMAGIVFTLAGVKFMQHRDTSPFGFAISNLVIAFGLFYYRLFDLVPVSRKLVIEHLGDAVLVLDRKGRVIDFNPAAVERVGKSADQIMGRPQEEVFWPWPGLLEKYGLAEKAKEIVAIGEGDQRRFYEMSLFPLGGPDGNPAGRIVIARDVTAQKLAENILADSRAELERMVEERTMALKRINEELEREINERTQIERALTESEEKYRLLINNIPDVAWTSDIKGGTTFISPTVSRIYGFTAEEIMERGGELWFERIHPDDRPRMEHSYQRLFEDGSPFDVEYRVRHQDGHWIWVHDRAFNIFEVEGKKYAYGVFSDITERRRVEEELIRSQKLESLGLLAGGIAHDFNNLMMAIQGNASLALLKTDASAPAYERLKHIETLVESASDLTRQLLALGRGGKYEVVGIDINDLVNSSSRVFGRTKKEVSIHLDLAEGPLVVEADRGQLEQVLFNLFVNAGQAMPEGGDLYIETNRIVLDQRTRDIFEAEPGEYIRVTVTDTGLGMDEETKRRAFEPFFTTKEKGIGTGLGLASTYGIVRNHGGFISLYSEPGKGATFNIHLPASGGEARERARENAEAVRGEGMILIIDDEPGILEVGAMMLEEFGYEPLAADEPEQGLELLRQHLDQVRLVIMDMIMPNISGENLFERIKEVAPSVKVLLASGYSRTGQASRIIERGCDGFIQKPYTMTDLSRKLAEIIGDPSSSDKA